MKTRGMIALVFLMMFCFPLISFAEDGDGDQTNETCEHYWIDNGIQRIDDESHGHVYQCEYCGETKVEDAEGHDWDEFWYEEEYAQCDGSSHLTTTNVCQTCGAKKQTKESHYWEWWDDEKYSKLNETYHYWHTGNGCYYCGAKEKIKEKHEYNGTKTYSKCDGTNHYRTYKCYYCGQTKKVKQKHNFKATKTYSKCNGTYHYRTYKCSNCGLTKKVKQKHDFTDDYYGTKLNSKYHKYHYSCVCGAKKTVKKKHTYSSKWDTIIRKATLTKKAKIKRECDTCSHYKYIYKKWNYKDSSLEKPVYSRSYWCTHSTVTKNSRYVRVKMDTGKKGAIVKLKIGKKTYKKKLRSDKTKNIKIRIKKPKFKQKVSIRVYYRNKLVGEDYNSTTVVTPGNKVKNGMTKAEVKYIWGSPNDTASASGGWSYWYYNDGSYVGFRNGIVRFWYDAAG